MVTIRRINLPYAEPQVTVTAKGSSPDKDQLLYTFINGQLVPAAGAAAVTPQMLQQLKAQMQQQNYVQPAAVPSKASVEEKSRPEQQPANVSSGGGKKKKNVVEVQKLQQKIQKEQQKVVEKQLKEEKEKKAEQKRLEELKSKQRNDGKKPNSSTTKKVNKPELKSGNEKSGKNTTKKHEQVDKKSLKLLTKPIVEERPENSAPEEEKQKKKKSTTFIDPEFDNNAFKLLNLDSDTEGSDESFSNKTDDEPPPPVHLKSVTNAKQNKTEPKQALKSNSNNNNQKNQRDDSQAVSTMKKGAVNNNKNTKQIESNQVKKTDDRRGSNSKKPPDHDRKNRGRDGVSSKSSKQSFKQELIDQQELVNTGNKDKRGSDERKGRRERQREKQAKEAITSNGPGNNRKSAGTSIMEQLSRGVKVEGLQLPPGITLTRVDPNTMETIKAKKESINKISQPMKPQSPTNVYVNDPTASNYMMVNPMMGAKAGTTSDNIIMVNTPKLLNEDVDEKKPREEKRRRRNRKRRNKNRGDQGETGVYHNAPQMVTLRNPLFNSMPETTRKQPAVSRPPMAYDQPAAIIKNENGMFTIRNPALHQALSQGQVNNLPHYNAYCNANSPLNGVSAGLHPQLYDPGEFYHPGSVDADCESGRKCASVIGSEIKTAHQIKQAQQKEQQHHQQQQHQMSWGLPYNGGSVPNSHKCYSPFEPVMSTGAPVVGGYSQNAPGYFDTPTNAFGGAGSNNGGTNNGLYTNGRENFSPQPTQSSLSQGSLNQNFYDNSTGTANGCTSKYDDMSFLQSLQPGQRLNSEVS